jgi:hypothetical protein
MAPRPMRETVRSPSCAFFIKTSFVDVGVVSGIGAAIDQTTSARQGPGVPVMGVTRSDPHTGRGTRGKRCCGRNS